MKKFLVLFTLFTTSVYFLRAQGMLRAINNETHPSAGAITYNSNKCSNRNAGTGIFVLTCTPSSNVAAGDFIVLGAWAAADAAAAHTCDEVGNILTVVSVIGSVSGAFQQDTKDTTTTICEWVYSAHSAGSGADVITITFIGGSGGNGANYPVIMGGVFSGVKTSGWPDQVLTYAHTTSADPDIVAAGATVGSGLLYSFCLSNATLSVGSGFSALNNLMNYADEYKILGASATEHAAWFAASAEWACLGMTYKPQ